MIKKKNKIPEEMRLEMADDPFYEKCVVTGHRPVEWHHVFMYGGKSIQEKWAIVPIIKEIHDQCTPHKSQFNKKMMERVELISLNRATTQDLARYSKLVDLIVHRDNLREKYANNNS